MKPIPLACIAFAAGLAGGWFTTGGTQPSGPTADAPPPSPRMAARQQRTVRKAAVPADVAARLAPIYAATDPSDRLKATILLAQTLPVSEMERWYENKWFFFKDGTDTNVFYEITRSRWLEEDPESLMEVAIRKNWEVFGRLAGQWARLDPDRAIAYLDAQRDPRTINKLQSALMGDLAKSRPDWVLARISGEAGSSDHRWQAALASLADLHPEKLAAATADWPAAMRQRAEQALTTARLTKDFGGEFDRLLRQPNGSSLLTTALNDNYDLSKQLSDGVFSQLDRLPPEWIEALSKNSWSLMRNDPERWLGVDFAALGVAPETADRLRNSALNQLAGSDPLKALNYLSSHGLPADGGKASLQRALLQLERTTPGTAAGWLDRLAGSPEQGELRASIEAALEPDSTPAKPATAGSLLESLGSAPDNQEAFRKSRQALVDAPPGVQQDFARMLGEMEPSRRAEIGRSVLSQGGSSLPLGMRGALVEAALAHPDPAGDPSNRSSQSPSREASNLAVAWVLDDPAAATRWATQLPAGEARQWALRNMASNWMPYDVTATEGWLASLPAADRADVQSYLAEQKE